MQDMPNSKRSIPDRWEDYSMMGKVIHGTSIMPIKVPLRESLTSNLSPEERFSPSILLKLFQEQELKLGGVVDLTFTTKYYDSKNGVAYKKVFTKGHVIPDDNTYNQFAKAMKELEKEEIEKAVEAALLANSREVTCVHCTHGLNRSGYLICRYMIENLNIEPQAAIRVFEEARGHKMERKNYIGDLMRRKPGVITHNHTAHDATSNDNVWNDSPSSQHHDDTRWNGVYDSGHPGSNALNWRQGCQLPRGRGYSRRQDDAHHWSRDSDQPNHRSYDSNSVYSEDSHYKRSQNNFAINNRGRNGMVNNADRWQNGPTTYELNSDAGSMYRGSRSKEFGNRQGHQSGQMFSWQNTEGCEGSWVEGHGSGGYQGSSRLGSQGPYGQDDNGGGFNMPGGGRSSFNNWRGKGGGGRGGRYDDGGHNKAWWGSGNGGHNHMSTGSEVKRQHIRFDD